MGFDAELLGHAPAIQRRFRQELDQSAGGHHSISLGYRRFVEEHLADLAGPAGGAGRALLRRRAGGAFRNPRCRRNLVSGARAVRSSASSALDAGKWRTGSAHHCARPRRQAADVRRHLSRRRLPHQRWRATWTAQNRGIRAMFMPDKYPEFGQCVHKIAMHPARPERLFLQNHWGLYRSDDCGESWKDIANGVPSDFGFAMVMHPRNPDCVYIIPVESDEFRCACDGRLRVYRTRNGGASWEPLMRGLPQKRAYETVLRDAMTADSLDPVGIYFGTRSGQLFGSRDEGRTWQKILEGLPAVVCVRSAVVEDASGGLGPTLPKASPAPSRQTKSLCRKARRVERRGDPCR